MKKIKLIILLIIAIQYSYSQTCSEWINYVKSEDSYPMTYTSFNSDAISKVSFYNVIIDYQTYYFAIVCFKQEYSYSCNEYIYQVSYNTQSNYSMNYLTSAGKAFWDYINPYNSNLDCAPNLK